MGSASKPLREGSTSNLTHHDADQHPREGRDEVLEERQEANLRARGVRDRQALAQQLGVGAEACRDEHEERDEHADHRAGDDEQTPAGGCCVAAPGPEHVKLAVHEQRVGDACKVRPEAGEPLDRPVDVPRAPDDAREGRAPGQPALSDRQLAVLEEAEARDDCDALVAQDGNERA